MLHYVFLQRIANMYPATGEIISSLLERIQKTLPIRERKTLEQLASNLNPRIIFMGTQPSFEENSSEKIKIILQAIRDHRKIDVTYVSDFGEKKSLRIPLMVVIYQNEIYIGCESSTHPGDTYVLKFRRIKEISLTKETFVEDPKILEKLRKRVISGAAILGKQEPKAEEVLIKFDKQAKFFLEEKPFHRSMKIKEEPNGTLLISMKVEVNELLFRWVLSYADCATVIKPFSLRQKLHDFGNHLLSAYPTYGNNTLNFDF
jgi:predicted DNA-binding transcriptional regulator YafY